MKKTLARIARELLDTSELSQRTISLYEQILHPFVELHGYKFPNVLEREDIHLYLESLTHLSYRTQRLHYTVLSRLFNYAEQVGYSSGNPCRFIKVKKPNKERGEHSYDQKFSYLTRNQIVMLIKASKPNPRLLALTNLLYESGMRISEALTLTLDNLQMNKYTAEVIGKGNKKRTCYFGENTRKALSGYIASHRAEPSNAVFTQRMKRTLTIRPLPYRVAYQDLREAIKDFPDLQGISFHALRHTFATERASLLPIEVVRALMGHEHIATTLLYQKISSQVAREQAIHALEQLRLPTQQD